MSQQSVREIKLRKGFYRNSFRRAVVMLILSLIVNLSLIAVIYYKLVTKPGHDFYATSGIKPPIKLDPMPTPNYSSKYLLPPDPVSGDETKSLPQGT